MKKSQETARAKMLTWRCGVSVPIVFHFPFSARTLIKHLPSSNQNTFCPHRIRAKTLTTTRIVNSSHFETLNTRQQEQIHLYVDALLQWNRVSLFCIYFYVFLFGFIFKKTKTKFAENESNGC